MHPVLCLCLLTWAFFLFPLHGVIAASHCSYQARCPSQATVYVDVHTWPQVTSSWMLVLLMDWLCSSSLKYVCFHVCFVVSQHDHTDVKYMGAHDVIHYCTDMIDQCMMPVMLSDDTVAVATWIQWICKVWGGRPLRMPQCTHSKLWAVHWTRTPGPPFPECSHIVGYDL